jgi:hypothetical protein
VASALCVVDKKVDGFFAQVGRTVSRDVFGLPGLDE